MFGAIKCVFSTKTAQWAVEKQYIILGVKSGKWGMKEKLEERINGEHLYACVKLLNNNNKKFKSD